MSYLFLETMCEMDEPEEILLKLHYFVQIITISILIQSFENIE